LLAGDNAALCALLSRTLREHINATRTVDEFRDPTDAGYHRLIPFLEVDAWTPPALCRTGANVFQTVLQPARERVGFRHRTDEGAERADHGHDTRNVT